MGDDSGEGHETLMMLADAFRDNGTLERLVLGSCFGSASAAMTLTIFAGLSEHATLREMELYGDMMDTLDHWNALSSCLCTTLALRQLKLTRCAFSAEKMRAFLNCLLQRGA
jgi:hypothetical protein